MAGNVKTLPAEFEALELFSYEEQCERIAKALHEISPGDYAGPDPPDHISGEPKCRGQRMFQFVWNSACCSHKQMCLKFCIVNNRFILLSFHEAYNPNTYEGRKK